MSESLNVLHITDRDWPFWDYAYLTAGATQQAYVVGANNVATDAIRKIFTAKETLIICDGNTYVRFNDARSTQMLLLANVAYTFRTNIYMIVVQRVGQSDTHVYAFFEGTEPQETRSAR